jgi:DNA-binding NarL/FixJ family response regulator
MLLHNQKIEVIGEAADWSTTFAQVPESLASILLVEWELIPSVQSVAIAKLRQACADPLVVILFSNLEARQHSALSTGADVFISKTDPAEVIAQGLMTAVSVVPT